MEWEAGPACMGPGDTGRLSLVKYHGYVHDLAGCNCMRATVAPA
uniref:Uncharacterized protein n=1 Tax=Peronospora matthiolae TaxID=2874970 RepID=A0AAV1T055_9STRA